MCIYNSPCKDCLSHSCDFYKSTQTELCLQQNVNISGEFDIVIKGPLTEDEVNVVCPVGTTQPVLFTQGNEVETIAADESLPTYNGYVLVAIMWYVLFWIVAEACVSCVVGFFNRLRPRWWVLVQRRSKIFVEYYISPTADYLFNKIMTVVNFVFKRNQQQDDYQQDDDNVHVEMNVFNQHVTSHQNTVAVIPLFNYTTPHLHPHPPPTQQLPRSYTTTIANTNFKFVKNPPPPPSRTDSNSVVTGGKGQASHDDDDVDV